MTLEGLVKTTEVQTKRQEVHLQPLEVLAQHLLQSAMMLAAPTKTLLVAAQQLERSGEMRKGSVGRRLAQLKSLEGRFDSTAIRASARERSVKTMLVARVGRRLVAPPRS
jgi:hypothetical protein